ncbi:MAG: alpha/beta fold hydrolase [Chloroflexi bacterium]|nr:alpha/beta fold hydrolase [Chloroflexota bacterium]
MAIAYAVSGSGPTLVHLPGVPLSNFAAERRIPSLKQAYSGLTKQLRFVQYDGRGTGHSQRDVDGVTLDAMLRDLEAVVAAVSADRFTLLGFYMSCLAAIAYASRHPARVKSLVLFGGATRGWDLMSSDRTQALISLIDRDWGMFVESATHAWLGWPDPLTGALAAEAFREATTPTIARQAMREASRMDVTSEAQAVRCPALVLHRPDASGTPLGAAETLAAALPDCRLELLPGTSSHLFGEHPDEVVQRIVQFIANPSAPPTSRPPGRAASGAERGLSPREADVLRCLAAGDSNGEIARRLGLSVNTVERHVTNVYRKIDARSRSDATAFAIRTGIV